MEKNKCHCGLTRCNLHRQSKTPFYRKWWHIRARCTFKWDKDYKNYGERGIKFEWKSYLDFHQDMYQSFLNHANKHGVKNTTIDRIDVNKNYNKENCKWITFQQQSLNKRNSRIYLINGKAMNISLWAKKIGCSRQALKYRLDQGMDPYKAITVPFKHSNKYAHII